MKDGKKPTNDTNKTPATSSSYATEVKVGGKKVTKDSKRIAEEIQAAEYMLHYVTNLTDDKEGRNRSTVDTKPAEKSSNQRQMNTAEKFVLDKIEDTVTSYKRNYELDPESVVGYKSSSQYQDKTNSILDIYQGLDTFLKFRYEKVFANTERRINFSSEHIERLWNIFRLPNEMSKPDAKDKAYLVLRVLKAVRKAADVQTTKQIPKEDNIEISTDLRNNGSDSSVHGIQKPTQLPQECTVKKKGEKKGSISTGNIQIIGKSPDDGELECNTETLTKKPYGADERLEIIKDGSEMKLYNEMVNLDSKQIKSSVKSNQGFQHNLNKHFELVQGQSGVDVAKHTSLESELNILKETRDLQIAEIEAKESNAETFEKINASKEKADTTDDIMRHLKEAEEDYKKGKESDSAIGVAGKLLLNTTDDKNDRKNDSNDTNRYYGGIQDNYFNKGMSTLKLEIENCSRKNKQKITSHEKTKILPVNDFNPGLEELISKQNFNLDNHRDMESGVVFSQKKRDSFCSEKGHITDIAKTECHEKIRDTTDLKDEDIEEAVSRDKSDEKPKATVEELEIDDIIHFELETDHINICAGDKLYYCSSKDKQGIPFNFKDENIQISFAGNHIFVSTENSEFDISFRRIDSVNLTNEATQTDMLL